MKITYRIILDILIAFAVLNAWWPVAFVLMIWGAWICPFFIEALIAGVAYDALFGMAPGQGWGGYIGTIVSVVVIGGIYIVKKFKR